jgi:hypothetical protein
VKPNRSSTRAPPDAGRSVWGHRGGVPADRATVSRVVAMSTSYAPAARLFPRVLPSVDRDAHLRRDRRDPATRSARRDPATRSARRDPATRRPAADLDSEQNLARRASRQARADARPQPEDDCGAGTVDDDVRDRRSPASHEGLMDLVTGGV